MILLTNCYFTFLDQERGEFKLKFENWTLVMPLVGRFESDFRKVDDINDIVSEDDIEFIRRNLQKNKIMKD